MKSEGNILRNREIIVLAPGVWDLFHTGHLNILRNAKGLGDKLIVAVTTDECSIKEKGKVPIVPYEHRVEIIKAIRYVDCVVPQTTLDKTNLIKKLKPDFIVVGDDWDRLKGQEVLEKRGGRVIFLPYTGGVSTTELIKRVKDNR